MTENTFPTAEDKLTQDDIDVIDSALRHCGKQSAYIEDKDGNEVDFGLLRDKLNKQQIIQDHEIVERLKYHIKYSTLTYEEQKLLESILEKP